MVISRLLSWARQHHSLTPPHPRLTLLRRNSYSSLCAAPRHSEQLRLSGATSSTSTKAFPPTSSSSPQPFSGYQDVQLSPLNPTQLPTPISALSDDTARPDRPHQQNRNLTVLFRQRLCRHHSTTSYRLHRTSNRRRYNVHPMSAVLTDHLESSATLRGHQLKAHALGLGFPHWQGVN